MKTKKRNDEAEVVHMDKTGLDRFIFFSDALFAFAITLLVLNIQLPDGPKADLAKQLLALWPEYIAYLIGFLSIGTFWISHHRKFRYIVGYDKNLIWLNLLLLMVIAFMPFPTSLISELGDSTATIFYASIMAVASLCSFFVWLYAQSKPGILDPNISKHTIRVELYRPLAFAGIFVISIGIAFFNATAAMLFWLTMLPVSHLLDSSNI